MCDCRKDIESRLLSRFKEQSPEASEHKVGLNGYTFILGDSLQMKGFMPIEATAKFPMKKGGTKEKKIKQSLIFTFCPFCGERYDKEGEAAA